MSHINYGLELVPAATEYGIMSPLFRACARSTCTLREQVGGRNTSEVGKDTGKAFFPF